MNVAILSAALRYWDSGISFIPILADGSKSPAWPLLPAVWCAVQQKFKHPWKPFQLQLPTVEQVQSWFGPYSATCGIAVVCGKVSGGLEMIDFDDAAVIFPWAEAIERAMPGLLDRLIIVQTPRPGFHVYFRSPLPEGNQRLARRLVLDSTTGNSNKKTVIETRGEGGYCIVPPSPPVCHPSGRSYEFLRGLDLTHVPMLSIEERNILITKARELDELPKPLTPPFSVPANVAPTSSQCRAGDDFNRRGTWQEILEPAGWTLVEVEFDGVGKWRRPGKSTGTSATTDYEGRPLLHVFSSNAEPLEADRNYSKFAAFAALHCKGDFKVAARRLAQRGFGRRNRSGSRGNGGCRRRSIPRVGYRRL